MPDPRRIELDDLINRPGTYFNPQTEVLIVVDDSPEMDTEIFDTAELDGPEWVLISDEVPVDESQRDELLEQFQVHFHADGSQSHEDDEDDEDEFDADDEEPEDER